MEDSETYSVPKHYQLMASHIEFLIAMIKDAFVQRPTPSGYEASFTSVSEWFLQQAHNGVVDIAASINSPMAHLLHLPEDQVQPSQVLEVAREMESKLRRLIDTFHRLWEHPFAAPFEHGQTLLSAMVEQPLRDVLAVFEQYVDVVESPERAVQKYGSRTINLFVNFSLEQEGEAFHAWLDQFQRQANSSSPQRESGLLSGTIMGFLLGWWLGDKR